MSDQPIDMRPDHEALVRDILLARLPKGVRVWVFGSRATWRAKPYSDLDLALEASEPLPAALVDDLVDEFRESDLPWKVDVLDLNAIAPTFRAIIDKDRVVFPLGAKNMDGHDTYQVHRAATAGGVGMRTYSIGQIGKVTTGKTPKTADPDNFGDYIPFITPSDMDGRRLINKTARYLSEKGAQSVMNCIIPAGTVLVSCIGSDMGKTHIAARQSVTNQQINSVIVDEMRFNSIFIYYNLFGRRGELRNLAAGSSAQPILNKSNFSTVEIELPPLPEQRAIAAILGSLDDKIELNRRMNETLEAMARAIFKDWFVDFGPTRAKAEGREPYLALEVWDLFPDRLGEDGLPEGWAYIPLVDVIDFKEGPGIRNWQYTNSNKGVHFINIRCIKDKNISTKIANRVSTEEAYGKYSHFLLKPDDVVVSTSGTLGRYAIVRHEHLPLMLNTSVIRMRAIAGISTRNFIYGYIGSQEFLTELKIRASGSVQKNFGPVHLKQMSVMLPAFSVVDAHNKMVNPFIEKYLKNQKGNETLAQLRDTLLPKLMSGEIRVREAQHLAEDVG